MKQDIIRLAVSGTYSTGKSTTTEALSLATGIPRTHAKTSREILLEIIPGKQVQELTATELLHLGMRRLEERIHNEAAQPGSFISDGSVIHEWIYGVARMKVGINPSAGLIVKLLKEVIGLPVKPFFKSYMNAYGELVKNRAKRLYHGYIHLPVEFEMVSDNHRPVSEKFRRLSDELLIETLDEIGIPYQVVGGSIDERVKRIIELHELPIVMSIEEATEEAIRRVAEHTRILEEDARYHSNMINKSLLRRIQYAFRY